MRRGSTSCAAQQQAEVEAARRAAEAEVEAARRAAQAEAEAVRAIFTTEEVQLTNGTLEPSRASPPPARLAKRTRTPAAGSSTSRAKDTHGV